MKLFFLKIFFFQNEIRDFEKTIYDNNRFIIFYKIVFH